MAGFEEANRTVDEAARSRDQKTTQLRKGVNGKLKKGQYPNFGKYNRRPIFFTLKPLSPSRSA
jgi:hypothetical protein